MFMGEYMGTHIVYPWINGNAYCVPKKEKERNLKMLVWLWVPT